MSDPFYVDPAEIPKDVSYGWKREYLNGTPDTESIIAAMSGNWRPVPGDRHPAFKSSDHVRVGGMILMERPKEDTARSFGQNFIKTLMQRPDNMNGRLRGIESSESPEQMLEALACDLCVRARFDPNIMVVASNTGPKGTAVVEGQKPAWTLYIGDALLQIMDVPNG